MSTKGFESNISVTKEARQPLLDETPARKPQVYDFVAVFVVLLTLTTLVEANAAHSRDSLISDFGFSLTAPLHNILAQDQKLNDLLAFINSLALFVPLFYSFFITTLTGDYELIFRIIAGQVLRSVCGCFTHIAPDTDYLPSNYDYPDIIHCVFQDCSATAPEALPFISFYSGHVTNMVICGNDMWLRFSNRMGKTSSILIHLFNVFQVVRMLATRGHYTIDIIMGWVVAVYFTSGAGAMGRAYTQGTPLWKLLPRTPQEIWYLYTGIGQIQDDQQSAKHQVRRKEIEALLQSLEQEEDARTDTTGSIRSDSDGSSSD